MSERERLVERLLRSEGLSPIMVGIGHDDDLPWAKFQVGTDVVTLVATEADTDEGAAAEIVLQARERGIA